MIHPTLNLDEAILASLIAETSGLLGVYQPEEARFLVVNLAGLSLFGYEDTTSFSEKFNDRTILKHASRRNIDARLRNSLEKHGFFIEENEFLRADGSSFWALMEVHPFEHRQKPHYLVRIVDIDNGKKSQVGLQYHTQRLEALFDNATMGIVITDETGTIIATNQYSDQLFGYETGELLGQLVEVLLPDAVVAKHEQHWQRYRQNPQKRAMGVGLDLSAKRKNGELFPVEVSLGSFHNEGKLFVVAFVVDVTFKKQAEKEIIRRKEEIEKLNAVLEQKVNERTKALLDTLRELEKSEKELAEALAKEKELNELKSRFVSMASHEFRTPLSGILSSVNLIKKYTHTEDQEKRDKHIKRIEDSVMLLTDILEDFLSMSKLEEGKVEVKPSEFSLPELFDETLLEVQGLLKPGQQFTFDHSGEEWVYLDRTLLRKALLNLFSNAIKFSPEDSVIEVNSKKSLRVLEISIHDQGIGISEEDQKHLFERFFRAANAANIQGTGLGLHIVAKYVDLMQGEILLKSRLNEGTTFTLIFHFN